MKKILLVEDDPMLIEIYKKKLVEAGYEVETVESGLAAEKKVEQQKYDLMLLDLMIPDEDGFKVLEKVKKNKNTKELKIVVFSNLSQPEDMQKTRELGATDFIVKSNFTPQQIVEKVKDYLGASEIVGKAAGFSSAAAYGFGTRVI